MSKDRLSIHQDSGGQFIQEAFTIMRDGGTIAQSGLVGITNSGYPEGGQPIIPQTLFNTQAARESHIRFSSAPSGILNRNVQSSIQILGNGNTRSSGIQITYYPDCDNTVVEPCSGDDCDDGNNPVYTRYTLLKCDTTDQYVYVYDPLGVSPFVDQVVSYELTDGSTGCGTVNSYTQTSNQDSSRIVSNFGYNGCNPCKGGPPPQLQIYRVSPCVGGNDIYVKNSAGFDITGDPVIKYTLNGVLQCGTLDTSSATAGSSDILVEGIVTDCNDSVCLPPDPSSRFYEIYECGTPSSNSFIFEETNSYIFTPATVITMKNDDRCWIILSEVSSQPVDFSDEVEEIFDNCSDSDPSTLSCLDERYSRYYNVRLCPDQGGTDQTLVVGHFDHKIGFHDVPDTVVVYFDENWGDILGLPVPAEYCCEHTGNFIDPGDPISSAYIIKDRQENGDLFSECDCSDGTYQYARLDFYRCENGSFSGDVDTIVVRSDDPLYKLWWQYSDWDVYTYTINGTEYCGELSTKTSSDSTEYSTYNGATNTLTAFLGNAGTETTCVICEGNQPNDPLVVLQVKTYNNAFVDSVYDSNGDCISGGCVGLDCNDVCSFSTQFIRCLSSCSSTKSVGEYVGWTYDVGGSYKVSEIIQILGTDSNQSTVGIVTTCNPTVPGSVLYCANCQPDIGGDGDSGGPFGSSSEDIRYGSQAGDSSGSSESKAKPNAVGQDLVVSDFSLVRPSGTEGFEFGHLSFTERGYVGVGLTKANKSRLFIPNAPLTVNYAAYQHRDSGTISMRAQSSAPNNNGNYGKVYVKPFTSLGGSQALFFKDDAGVETNLLTVADIGCCEIINNYKGPSGMVYGDTNFNTYAGWNTPKARGLTTGIEKNTFYGQAAGFDLVAQDSSVKNTLIGFSTGSGAVLSSGMTVVGSDSFVNYATAKNSVIIGHNNVKSAAFVPAEDVSSPMSGIIIGTNLYVNSDPPTGILAIGHGFTPVVTGQLTGDASERSFAVDDATFIVSTGTSYELSINQNRPYTNFNTVFTSVDKNSTGTNVRDAFQFDVSNSDGYTVTLLEMYSLANERSNTPNYADQGFMWTEMNTDFRLKGAIRFQDGTSLSGVPDWAAFEDFSTSGVGITTYGDYRWFTLDFTELQLAQAVSNNVRTDNTFVAVQLDGTSSTNVGKMSLQGLADYVSDAFTNISENCNVILTDPENAVDLNATANSESVFIGCEVGTRASGWKNSVIIGNEAGWEATTPNPTLSTSTAAVFLGYRAGYDSDNTDNTIFIGTAAGRDADAASDSIFVGASAGLGSSYSDSIGIGQNSLRGAGVGEGNIEIVANLLDSQRLFHNAGDVDNRLNIQNIIAGDTSARFLSIGDARLSPEAPLEARRDSTIHSTTNNSYIQSWHHDDTVVGAVESDGSLSGFVIEGVLTQTLAAPSNTALSTTANLEIYYNGSTTSQITTITNRDPGFNAGIGAYILAIRIGGEYRPMNATCCGAGGIP